MGQAYKRKNREGQTMEKIVVANFKMNLLKEEIVEYIQNIENNKVYQKAIYCPASLYIPYFAEKNLKVGAQNISAYPKGAYTGQISARQIKSTGASYVIVGHCESRKFLKETDEQIKQKIKEALNENIKVILCIGEKEAEIKKRKEILKQQIKNTIQDFPKENIIIAYEPVWAIGSGHTMQEEEIKEVMCYIKSIAEENIKVLYGGSVQEKNIEALSKIEEVDGFLVGNASTNPETFLKIIEVAVSM